MTSAATPSQSFQDNAGTEYAELVEDELAEQRALKASLEQRALALVSASGVFVTALFGLAGFLERGNALTLSTSARVLLGLAGLLFVIAGLLALWAVSPTSYLGVDPAGTGDDRNLSLERVIRSRWGNPPAIARRRVALTRLALYRDYRRANGKKANLVKVAATVEALAVLALGTAVAVIVAG